MLGCPGGSVFTEFLGALNACTGMPGPAYEGFAGHCDWRLPMMSELASIVDTTVLGCAVDAPCIDPIFGPTAIDFTIGRQARARPTRPLPGRISLPTGSKRRARDQVDSVRRFWREWCGRAPCPSHGARTLSEAQRPPTTLMRTLTAAFMSLARIWPGTGPLALSALSGGLYALGFPPWSVAALAWVALVPFFVAVSRLAPRQAAVCGVAWTLVAAYGVGWWFPAMIAAYFQVPALVGWVAFFVVSGTVAASYFAAFAAWLSWLTRRHAAHPLLVAAGWGACELARARLLFGNPWALSGYSQAGVAPLMQLADVAGVYGIGMLIAAVNAGIAGGLTARLRPRRPAVAYGIVAALWVSAFGYGSWRLGERFTSDAPVDVAIVQADVDHELRSRPGGRAAALARYLSMTEEAARHAPALVVWPENALDFYLQEPSADSEAVRAITHRTGADFLIGGPAYGFGGDTFRYTNSVFLLRAGAIAGRYDKLRPLPVAEEGLLSGLTRRPLSYERGVATRRFQTRAGVLAPFVCSDGVYPELVRSLTADDSVELLVDLSNDAWFGHGAPARHHLDMVTFRAVESRRFVVRAAATGYSAVIDPRGHIVASSALRHPEVLVASVEPSHARTLYQRWGDAPTWAAALAALIWSLAHARRVRRLLVRVAAWWPLTTPGVLRPVPVLAGAGRKLSDTLAALTSRTDTGGAP